MELEGHRNEPAICSFETPAQNQKTSESLECYDGVSIANARNGLYLVGNKSSHIVIFFEVKLDQQIKATRCRINLRGNFRIGNRCGHNIG